jgi:hypothetical protein
MEIVLGSPNSEIAELLEGFGITILNVDVDCSYQSRGTFSGPSDLPYESGLVISTGQALHIPNPSSFFAGSDLQGGSDPDLAMITGVEDLKDRCAIEFDCIPMGDTLVFNYVFASEEYPEYVCTIFNDVFGLFLSGPGISGPFQNNAVNVALLPGTDTPVSINTVNAGMVVEMFGDSSICLAADTNWLENTVYYTDNSGGQSLAFDGMTVDLAATAVVVPDNIYHFKAVVADATDGNYDSAVFLQAFSFRSNPNNVGIASRSQLKPVVMCQDGVLSMVLPSGHGGRSIRLLSTAGQEMAQQSIVSDRMEFNVGALPTGVYILQVLGERYVAPVRFVKN